ncbi:hypothetical protein AJ79_06480 [Helicocarpus griseus UAMH5409]|uniref:Uncharacterized protein n=1 Tax=Helicocarpus griseus UAMH5409 TaxID=1447875 RepID=A0A2B7XC45_9EURO|nr:hypothetical protein AJ79_06480 [Helicocarpus griseus UAMH5409]
MLSTNKLKALPTSAHSITQPPSRYTSPSRAFSYPPESPTRYSSTPPSSHPYPELDDSLSTLLDEKNCDKSNDADQQVKLALTELLNCANIKSDHEVRMWVQNKLMDTEHRLKARRKSRISNMTTNKSGLSILSPPGR